MSASRQKAWAVELFSTALFCLCLPLASVMVWFGN
jgi:hypothetical protein